MGGGHRETAKCDRREIVLVYCFMKKDTKKGAQMLSYLLKEDLLHPLGFNGAFVQTQNLRVFPQAISRLGSLGHH